MAKIEMDHERQIGEPAQWYNRFLMYLNQGGTRSMLEVCNQLRELGGKKRSPNFPPLWTKMSTRWDWKGRVDRYDTKKQKRILQTNIEFEAELRKKAQKIAMALLEKAEKMTEQNIFTQKKTIGPNGEQVIIKPAGWTQESPSRIAEAAMRLGMESIQVTERDKEGSEAKKENPTVDMIWLKEISERADDLPNTPPPEKTDGEVE